MMIPVEITQISVIQRCHYVFDPLWMMMMTPVVVMTMMICLRTH